MAGGIDLVVGRDKSRLTKLSKESDPESISEKEKLNDKIILKFKGDSDALIVKGLVVILFSIFSKKSPNEIIKIDVFEKLRDLDLERNLTMQRSNGLSSMVKRIKEEAQKYI